MLFVSRKLTGTEMGTVVSTCFNLGIEMLFVSSAQLPCRSCAYTPRFNLGIEMLFVSRPYSRASPQVHHVSISESRCFSFQVNSDNSKYSHPDSVSFNLGIEMLFVSSETEWERNYHTHWHASFNLGIEMLFVSSPYRRPCRPPPRIVSISESRCFSFQVRRHAPDVAATLISFQSRNRDAFRFKSPKPCNS